jgi:nitrogen regulatory protein PII
VSFVSKVKIELAIEASMLERVIEAIRTAGFSGQIGDGKIFIQNIERAMRIRTGETGQAAL